MRLLQARHDSVLHLRFDPTVEQEADEHSIYMVLDAQQREREAVNAMGHVRARSPPQWDPNESSPLTA
jgi:hypothetical protein